MFTILAMPINKKLLSASNFGHAFPAFVAAVQDGRMNKNKLKLSESANKKSKSRA
jgi:hypothetical protein